MIGDQSNIVSIAGVARAAAPAEEPARRDAPPVAERAAPRGRTLLRACVVFNGGLASLDCTVRDLSDTGAKLEFAGPAAVPSHFRLMIPKLGQSFHAQKRWQRDQHVGVSFERAGGGTAADGKDQSVVARLEAENARLRALVEAIRADPSQARLLLERFD